jgi:hypothetical protein
MRLVRMMTATPRLAVMAISWIMRMLMSMIVMNPMVSDSNAMPPGTRSRRKVERAAVMLSAPSYTSAPNAEIICTPWLTPMAKMRNGTRMDMGSMPKPSRVSRPTCQMTAMREHPSTITVSLKLWE